MGGKSLSRRFLFFLTHDLHVIRGLLIIGGVMGIGLGALLNRWFPEMYLPMSIYGSLSILAIFVGVLGFFIKHIRHHITDYAFIVYALTYLALIFLAFLNHLSSGFVILLVIGQAVISLSFRYLIEWLIFALASLVLFTFCSFYIGSPEIPLAVFLPLISSITLISGLWVWYRQAPSSQGNQTLLKDLLDSSIFGIFLLDNNCEEILYQNRIAETYLADPFPEGDITSEGLFKFMGLEPRFVLELLRNESSDFQEKTFFQKESASGESLEFEMYISKIRTLSEDNILIKIQDITAFRQQQKKLTRSISVNQSLINAIPDILITLTQEGIIHSIKAAQGFTVRLPLDSYKGKHFSELSEKVMSAQKQKDANNLILMAQSSGKLQQMEFFTLLDDTRLHYELRMVKLADDNEILAIIRDITESKEVEIALKQSEQNYREIFNAGADGIIIIHPSPMQILDSNKIAFDLLGYTKNEFLQLEIQQLIDPSEREAIDIFIDLAINGRTHRIDTRLLKKSGELLPVEISAKLTMLGGDFRLMLIIRDTSEQYEFSRKIRRYADLIENVNVGIALFQMEDRSNDSSFRLNTLNTHAQQLLRIEPEASVGRLIDEQFPYWRTLEIPQKLAQALRDQRLIVVDEIILEEPNQTHQYWQAKFIPLPGGYVGMLFEQITEQREKAKQIRKSEQKFRDLFGSSPEPILVTDLEERVLDANPAACKLYQSAQRDLINKPLSSLTPTFAKDHLQEVFLKMVKGEVHYHEGFVQAQLGDVIPVILRSSKFELEGVPAMILHVSDISEQKAAEERLRLFRSLINQSSDAIFVLESSTGKVIDFNEQTPASLGYTYEELQHLHIFGFGLAIDQRPIPEQIIEELRETGSSIYRGRHRRKDGSSFPVEVNIGYVKMEENEYLIGVARDISERIHQEEALRQSEQKYRTLVENMNEGLILTDNDETVLFVNHRLCQILDMQKHEILGRRSFEILGGEENTPLIRKKTSLRKGGISDQYEIQFRKKTGELNWLMIAGAPYVDSNNDSIGTIAIITDITARKATEIKLKEKNNELDAFVYKASHDLKGPLASIIGVTNIGREEVNDPSALRYFDLINKSTKRLDLILSELIDVTRMNKAKLIIEPINLTKIVEEIINSLKHLPKSQIIDFQTDISLTNGFQSDKKLLTSILQNLIVNSINYQNPKQLPPKILVSIKENHQRVEFTVSDNGVGIPEKMKKKVFEMFYRGNTQSKGSGLGLYIVKNSIAKLNGICELESEEGKGTTFHFSLPQEKA